MKRHDQLKHYDALCFSGIRLEGYCRPPADAGTPHCHLFLQEDSYSADARNAGNSTAHDADSQYTHGHSVPEQQSQGKAWAAGSLQQQAGSSDWDSPVSQQPQVGVGRSAWDDVPQAQNGTASYQDQPRTRLTTNGGGRQGPSYEASQGYEQQGYYEDLGRGSNAGSVSGSGYGQQTGVLPCHDQGLQCKIWWGNDGQRCCMRSNARKGSVGLYQPCL